MLVGRSKVPGCSESRGRPCAPRPARALPLPHRSPRSRPGPAAAVRDGDVVSRCFSACTTSRRCGAWWTASTRPSQTPQDAYVPRAPAPPRPHAPAPPRVRGSGGGCGVRLAGCGGPGRRGDAQRRRRVRIARGARAATGATRCGIRGRRGSEWVRSMGQGGGKCESSSGYGRSGGDGGEAGAGRGGESKRDGLLCRRRTAASELWRRWYS